MIRTHTYKMGTTFASILVIDDEPDLRSLYELTLLREGYRVESVGSINEAQIQLQRFQFNLVITDMRLPDGSGMDILKTLREQRRKECAIAMTAYGSTENAVEALRYGAFDYLTKPVDLKQFRSVVAAAISSQSLATPPLPPLKKPTSSVIEKQGETLSAITALNQLVGNSVSMQQVKLRIQKVAPSMAPILITGESGTGKELVARALHACSHRADAPWIAVNCGAIPEHLLESEFFGVRKGAFTGAGADRNGFFSAAKGGTLFLDEIGELPLSMQAKLLRAIQERSVRALGSTQEETVDVRVVSATHRDLAADVKNGSFRQDLYYRLNVIDICIPPLRDRREDLPALCTALLKRITGNEVQTFINIPTQVLIQLQNHALPGNVRELENILHRTLALGEDTEASTAQEDLFTQTPAYRGELPHDLQHWLDQQERAVLTQALKECGNNRTTAAARLGISLRQIRYRIERLNIPLTSENLDSINDDVRRT